MYIKSDVTYQIHVKTKKKCAIAQLCRLIIAGSSVVSVWARGGQKRWRCCQLPTHCYFLLSYELKIQKPGLAVRQASIARRGNCSRLPSPKRRPWISQVPVMRLCVAAAWSSLAHTKFMTSCLFTVFVYRAVEHTAYRLCLPCCWTHGLPFLFTVLLNTRITVYVYRAVEHTAYRFCLPCCWTHGLPFLYTVLLNTRLTVYVYRAVEHTAYRLWLPCCWTHGLPFMFTVLLNK